ncbi:MAG: Asd/ArgC dimerization domain-containing protein [Bryobacteraceae bacterium]
MASTIALVGGESLRARELREVLGDRKPAPDITLFGSSDADVRILTEQSEEAAIIEPLVDESLRDMRVAFLAGSPASSRKALRIASGAVLVDLSGTLEEQPHARLRAPLVEAEAVPFTQEHIHVVAHPAAVGLAMFFGQLSEGVTVKRSVVEIHEPASERGQRGLDELQKQCVALLSFQKLPDDVYDTQVAFNLLARYGEEAEEPLEDIELRIDRHLATLLARWPAVPMPSLRLIQAPVFHGYGISAWVEFEAAVNLEALAARLAAPHIDVRTSQEESPSNVGAAGQSGITVSFEADRNHPRAAWFWIALDNLRMTADNAVAIAESAL